MINQKRRRIHASARSAVLHGVLGFAALQLGLAVAIEYWLPELRDPEYAHRAARLFSRTTLKTPKPLTVVLLGSSRTTLGFKASQIEHSLATSLEQPVVVFNFGLTGAGPLMELIDLRRLLAKGIRPDLLLVEVLPPLLAGQIPPHELYRLALNRMWHDELLILERYGRPSRELRTAWWQDWPIPWYSHRYAIISRFLPACLPYQLRMDWAYQIDDSGWVPGPIRRSTPEGYRAAVENAKREYIGYLVGFRPGGPACRALRELLDLCRQQEITAGLVLMPEGSEFRSFYPPEAWAQMEAFLAELSREYQTPLINARDWVDDEMFSDSHHLLLAGATAFTERLSRDAILPLLLRAIPARRASEGIRVPRWRVGLVWDRHQEPTIARRN